MKKGSILIFTLWVLIILAIFSVMLSRRASTDIRLAKYESNNIKATYLARAGVMKMLAELTKDENLSYDSLNEDWNRGKDNPKELILMKDTVFFGASDESSRLNLNSPNLQIEQLVRLGMDEDISQKVLEYKDKKGEEGFEYMEELFLVEGMTRHFYLTIKDSVTIYRGTEVQVNINTAKGEVLEAIIGDYNIVQEILDYRSGGDGEEGTEDDGIF